MSKIVILLFDSFGIGSAPDAAKYGDVGADTLGHIAAWCALNRKNEEGRPQPLRLPHLAAFGLERAAVSSRGGVPLAEPLTVTPAEITGAYTYASPVSHGKDTLSGHWEMTGVPVMFDWGYFTAQENSFPEELLAALIKEGKLPGVLGNKRASGTEIIKELGEEHCRTGKPIVYTSADSVFQIAAHEEYFGLERLYELCQIAFKLLRPYKIARVIARPFLGTAPENYTRTGNRHDYAVPAPEDTLLDLLTAQGGEVHAVGKIADIFAHRGITKGYKATGLPALFDATLTAYRASGEESLIFTNFVDFDSNYGHRRDVPGYAAGLEYLDARLPELLALLRADDLVIVAADHGCDPTWQGSDHTRENIPALFYGKSLVSRELVPMRTFADIGQTLAAVFGFKLAHGEAVKLLRKEEEKC